MPVLVENDPDRAAALLRWLPASTGVVGRVADLEPLLAAHPDEHVVVLGPQVPTGEATTSADRLSTTHPAVTVVLVRPVLDSSLFELALDHGIRAVVSQDDETGLRTALERARQRWEALQSATATAVDASVGEDARGQVITVFSPKGGVGKTTIAVNLALALSEGGGSADPRRRRARSGDDSPSNHSDHSSRRRVCLVDLDLAFGDVAITLQLLPEHTVAEAIEVEAHLDYAMLQTLLTVYDAGTTILAAPTSPDAKDRIPGSLVGRVLTTLRERFDYVVVDTSPGFDEHVLAAFDVSDDIVLVATLDVPTVKNLKMAAETLEALGIAAARHLVVNRADDQVGLTVENVAGILKLPVAGSMPTALAVASATNHGRPIVAAKPDHPVSQSLRDLAARLAESGRASGPDATRQLQPSRRNLFGRRRHEKV